MSLPEKPYSTLTPFPSAMYSAQRVGPLEVCSMDNDTALWSKGDIVIADDSKIVNDSGTCSINFSNASQMINLNCSITKVNSKLSVLTGSQGIKLIVDPDTQLNDVPAGGVYATVMTNRYGKDVAVLCVKMALS